MTLGSLDKKGANCDRDTYPEVGWGVGTREEVGRGWGEATDVFIGFDEKSSQCRH